MTSSNDNIDVAVGDLIEIGTHLGYIVSRLYDENTIRYRILWFYKGNDDRYRSPFYNKWDYFSIISEIRQSRMKHYPVKKYEI